jgi:two-component system, LuxR family, response regulator FixJ
MIALKPIHLTYISASSFDLRHISNLVGATWPPNAKADLLMPALLHTHASLETPKVVLVDDDLSVLASLCFLLEAEGFDVNAFDSGVALLSQPTLPGRGCFVIDYHMPVMNGLELLARLRARRSNLPAFLMTGQQDGLIEQRAAHAGVSRVFFKPHLGDGLIRSIQKALQDH